ncbi:MAG: methylated-DNA--[protein]-cysteine S-methyltransferase [Rubricoccaceae bacterium]|nr:methylated-DNA--[protein]-cysteine S-methyltransferase [Rubricoccaceae bacterium]
MQSIDYVRIERAIQFVLDNRQAQPGLSEVASHVGLSEFHFERLFKEWAGVTPKRFLQYLTLKHAKSLLKDSQSVLGAAYEAGLSGGGRLYDLFVTVDAVTPGEFKSNGAGLQIRYGVHDSPFGQCFLATTSRGICKLSFVGKREQEPVVRELIHTWPEAEIIEDGSDGVPVVQSMFDAVEHGARRQIPVLLKGTNFQIKVWEALLRIPPGHALSYDDVAGLLGRPKATRAVASAVARNPVGYLIPCHRVIRKSGAISGYRWGVSRKAALLGWEAASLERD